MFRAKLGDSLLGHLFDRFHIATAFFGNIQKHGRSRLLGHAAILQIKAEDVLRLDGVIGKHLDLIAGIQL